MVSVSHTKPYQADASKDMFGVNTGQLPFAQDLAFVVFVVAHSLLIEKQWIMFGKGAPSHC